MPDASQKQGKKSKTPSAWHRKNPWTPRRQARCQLRALNRAARPLAKKERRATRKGTALSPKTLSYLLEIRSRARQLMAEWQKGGISYGRESLPVALLVPSQA